MWGSVALLTGGSIALESWRYRRDSKKGELWKGLDELVRTCLVEEEKGALDLDPIEESVFCYLPVGNGVKRVVRGAQRARDNLLFGQTPPQVKDAARYLAAQQALESIDIRLVYILDPALFLATQREGNLLLDTDLRSCRDGTYTTSIAFAAQYRNIVGEEAFAQRLARYQTREEPEKQRERQPWYALRPDYKSRLRAAAAAVGDVF